MVSVHASSEVGRWFEPQSGKTKDQTHLYLLLFRQERNINVKEQRLVGSE